MVDWNNFIVGTNTGIWSFSQVIHAGIDPATLICDFLPRTAEVGDCESGHTLDDDVEWPADLAIADYRISPDELVEFSMVDVLDSKPSFYNNEDDYEASNIDLLIDIDATSLTLGRLWTVTHELYDFTWTYSQTITIDFSDFSNLVTINTGTDRAMPGVMINEAFSTDVQGDAYVEGEPVNEIIYEDEYFNGVNILDLVLIHRDILDLEPLSEYGEYAADITDNEVVATTDALELRDILIGATPKDKGEWYFFDVEIESPLTVEPKGVYVGVKKGDVDDSALLQGEVAPDPDSKFEVLDILLNKGESYSIPVYLEDMVNTIGVEFRTQIDSDLIKVNDIISDYMDLSDSYFLNEDGVLAFVFSGVENSFKIGGESSEPVFYIEIEAKENSILSLALDMEKYPSYIASADLELIILDGSIGDAIGTGTNDEELSGVTIFPNPTTDYLNIDLKNVNVKGDTEVSIFDMNGKRLSNFYNNQRIDVTNLAAGMYYYQVKVDEYSTTGKFIVVK